MKGDGGLKLVYLALRDLYTTCNRYNLEQFMSHKENLRVSLR